jgi:hypothetical protein
MWYFHQSNRYTLSAFLGEDLGAAEAQAQWERFVIEAVRRTVSAAPAQHRASGC